MAGELPTAHAYRANKLPASTGDEDRPALLGVVQMSRVLVLMQEASQHRGIYRLTCCIPLFVYGKQDAFMEW